jgi:hypothetical protein
MRDVLEFFGFKVVYEHFTLFSQAIIFEYKLISKSPNYHPTVTRATRMAALKATRSVSI